MKSNEERDGWHRSSAPEDVRARLRGSSGQGLTFLAQPENALCVKRLERGLLNPGTMRMDGSPETNPRRIGLVVDHITPHRGDQVLFWGRSSWQPLCHDHHDIVKQWEEQGWALQGNDLDGRPTYADHPWNRSS